jgi:hypothetical protein
MKTAELGVFPHAETETEGAEAECLERMGSKIGMKNPISCGTSYSITFQHIGKSCGI